MLDAFDAADLDGNGLMDFSEFIKNEWQVTLNGAIHIFFQSITYRFYEV